MNNTVQQVVLVFYIINSGKTTDKFNFFFLKLSIIH